MNFTRKFVEELLNNSDYIAEEKAIYYKSLFKPGQKVRLRSGGPVMVISKLIENECECIWAENNEIYKGTFSVECLKFSFSLMDTICELVNLGIFWKYLSSIKSEESVNR